MALKSRATGIIITMVSIGKLGVLVSGACTTGWTDWVHGELWLCRSGLLRIRSGMSATLANGMDATVDADNRPLILIGSETIERLVRSHRTNRWIPKQEIGEARFHRGITTSRVLIRMRDGASVKLLWPKLDGGLDLLQAWLGTQVVLD